MQGVLISMKCVCFFGFGLNVYIWWKLLRYGTRSFINNMFLTIFSLNIFFVPLMIHFFFEIGTKNLTTSSAQPDEVLDNCKNYITIWLSCAILNTFFNVGMLFCRSVSVFMWIFLQVK